MATKGTRISHDFKPSHDSLEFCKRLDLQGHQVEWLRTKFVDYFTGPDASRPVKKDWDRAFRNWAERDAWRARKIVAAEIYADVRTDEPLWRARLDGWQRKRFWMDSWGERPGKPGCMVPKHLLKQLANA